VDHRRGAERSVGDSGWTMRPNVGRCDLAPRLLRGRHKHRLERDRGGHVVGVRRHVGEDHRHGMLARVTALEPRRIVLGARVLGVWVRHGGVLVRGGAVVVVGVIVVDVRVDVLQRRRPEVDSMATATTAASTRCTAGSLWGTQGLVKSDRAIPV
jgi:hypothetical protein